MNIADAMTLLFERGMHNACAKRDTWKDCALVFSDAAVIKDTLSGFDTGNTSDKQNLVMVNAEGVIAGWVPCIESLMADDWRVFLK